jgi:hypothetical protein
MQTGQHIPAPHASLHCTRERQARTVAKMLDPFLGIIDQILKEDKDRPR